MPAPGGAGRAAGAAPFSPPPAPTPHDRASAALARLPAPLFAAYVGLMAFGTYFAMYAFRKPFAAASFAGLSAWGMDYKVALVIAQVVGYAAAKLIGVRVIAQWPAHWRIAGIAGQVALAELALVGFGLIPAPWNVACLFADGLALGMVWGMVFAFVEGRRQSDLIGAMLCASFVLSSGVVKSVGEGLMVGAHVSAFWMPAATGLVFAPLMALCLAGLAIVPPPTAADRAARAARAPMDRAARRALLARYGAGLAGLVAVYVGLTALRDLRDNFAAEIWTEVGLGGRAELFTLSELPVCLVVLGVLAGLTAIADSGRALRAYLALMGLGLAVAAGASGAFLLGALGPLAWMILLGAGLYLAYTPYNAMLFDRLVAAGARGEAANAGFLIYVADASGYAGSVALLGLGAGGHGHWAQFLAWAGVASGGAGLAVLAWCGRYFARAMPRAGHSAGV